MTPRIHASAKIECDDVELGQHVVIGEGARIKCSKLRIGDCTEIGPGFRVDCGEVSIGDYGLIYENCLLYGKERLSIGHNFFLGGHSILNSYAPLSIGKGVGIGAYSQVWTHASWGEELEGCVLNTIKPTTIHDHAWLVGHVIVAAGVTIGERATVLSAAMVTRDIPSEVVVGGVPAKLIARAGYTPLRLDQKWNILVDLCSAFATKLGAEITKSSGHFEIIRGRERLMFTVARMLWEPSLEGATYFTLDTKTYSKHLTTLEIEFMRFCRGGKARFFPE